MGLFATGCTLFEIGCLGGSLFGIVRCNWALRGVTGHCG